MKSRISIFLMTILLSTIGNTVGLTQEQKKPVTREEILQLLSQKNERRFAQGDIAAEVSERGIAFPVDEATMEEFRRAGARAILLDAITRAGQKPSEREDRPRLRTQGDQLPPTAAEEPTPEARAEALARLPFLEQARYHAMMYAEDLPDFRVTQFVTRYARGPASKDWELQDKLEVALSFHSKQGEKFQLLKLNGAATKMSYEQLGGSTSTGEFGSVMQSLFSPDSKADFKEVRSEVFNGRKTVLYDFSVKKANSSSQLTDKSSGRSVVSGYSGSCWIDVETKRVLRVELAHENIQPGFPITMAESAIDYDFVTIAEEKYVLPVRAEMLLGRDREREYTRNVIEFRDYRKFDSDVKLVP